MKKMKEFFAKNISRLFKSTADVKIIEAINADNMQNVYRFSLIGIALESVSLLLYVISSNQDAHFHITIIHVSICIAACIFAVIISKMFIGEYEKKQSISDFKVNAFVSAFYILLSFWGIMVDAMHYMSGRQMLTFYIVQFCFVSFIVMKPKLGSILIMISFAALYMKLYLIDGAVSIQILNLIIFMVIAVLGNAIKYRILQGGEQKNIRIMELNQILQQEAVIDDLTKIKNRKALSNDLEHYIGKHVYVIMADVDHFKQYNDTYGHLIGDRVLSEVAEATEKAFAEGNTYRYGGDEFLIMLPDITEEVFKEKIEKWKQALRDIQISNIEDPITCSYGSYSGVIENAAAFREYLRRADLRLYNAKNLL